MPMRTFLPMVVGAAALAVVACGGGSDAPEARSTAQPAPMAEQVEERDREDQATDDEFDGPTTSADEWQRSRDGR